MRQRQIDVHVVARDARTGPRSKAYARRRRWTCWRHGYVTGWSTSPAVTVPVAIGHDLASGPHGRGRLALGGGVRGP
jgi:hypothetical protein